MALCEEELKAAAMPYVRPSDYFAEMVKTDKHMLRVKAALLHQRNKLDKAAKRDRDRELRKLGKAVQESRTKEKAMAKNAQVAAVKQWRQKRKRAGGAGDDFDLALLDEAVRLDGKAKRDGPPAPGAKRIAKNRKFGTGSGLVRKRELKRNSDVSTSDMRDFDKFHRKTTFGRGGGRGGGGAGRGGGGAGRGGGGGGRGGGPGARGQKRGSAKRPGKRARSGQH